MTAQTQAQMFIGTRFGIGVRDASWFEHRLALFAAVTAPSILAQEDQTFQWAIFVDSALPPFVRHELEEILRPFDGRAFIHVASRHGTDTVLPIAQERKMLDANGYLLTARIDDDDAWHVSTVGVVRERVAEWHQARRNVGFGLCFENGLEWIMYDMVNIEQLQKKGERVTRRAAIRPFSFIFHSMSSFFYSRPLEDDISALSVPHSESAAALSDKGLSVEIVPNKQPMWLYCRHKQTVSEAGTRHDTLEGRVDKTLADLSREFGLDAAKTARYLSDAENYGYCLEKGNEHHRIMLARALEEVQLTLDNPKIDENQRLRLEQEKSRLTELVTRSAENVIGDPEEIPASSAQIS
jgi:hypothetical protein